MDIEDKRKHMKGKSLLIGGLATVATIHAAHTVFANMEKHEERKESLAKSNEKEARKARQKGWVQDAAAIGIAAFSIHGAMSEWKEMKEHR